MNGRPISRSRRCATASGMAAPPPPMRISEDRSRDASPGVFSRSTIIAVMPVMFVIRQCSISRTQASRSQRDISTMVTPWKIGAFMPPCMPVTWNIGSTASCTRLGEAPDQAAPITVVLITVRWVWMQPFGWPVVPEV